MSVHYMQGVVCAASLGVSTVSIGRHPNWGTQPPPDQTGPSIAPENYYVGGTLAGLQLQRGNIRDGHIGGEQTHNLTFRQGLTVQLSQWLVVNRCVVTKTCRKKAKLVATPLESFGNLRLKRSVPSSMSSRFRPDPTKRTKVPAIPWRRGQSSASPHAPQSQCQCHTIDTWCRLLSAPTGACTLTNGRCHTTYCIPDNAIVATHEVPTGRIGNKHTLRGYSTRFTVLQYTVPCTWPVPESTWPHTVLALVLDIIGSCWLCIVGGPGRVAAGPGLCRNGTHEMAVCD